MINIFINNDYYYCCGENVIPKAEEPKGDLPDLIPARMLNEFAYCPRLCYIEWVQGEFLDSSDTVEGRFQHRRVDAASGKASQNLETFHARSVYISGAGITCKIDLLDSERDIVNSCGL